MSKNSIKEEKLFELQYEVSILKDEVNRLNADHIHIDALRIVYGEDTDFIKSFNRVLLDKTTQIEQLSRKISLLEGLDAK